MPEIARANANASRAFFVRMLTRDISVEDCILDLIDNSVDAAWRKLGKKRLGLQSGPNFSKAMIDVKFDEKGFTITDNGGGMSLEVAKAYAFTFGRTDVAREEEAEFSIGVYGIGLKRAIFKLGEKIDINSTYKVGTKRSSFVVPIDVPTWVKGQSKDWDFPIKSAADLENDGLKITVTKLTDPAKARLGDGDFEPLLIDTIARDYALHLHHGLTIKVNGHKVRGEVFKLLSGGDFEPLNDSYVEKIGEDEVHVEIAAGYAFPPPESNDPTEKTEREEKSGWYVACNGRVVMAADKSMLSVWGDDFPAWHPQYTGFYGIMIFSSDNTELLPLTTTKRSIDLSSVVYRRARPKMKPPTRAWIDYTNARKNEVAAAEQRESLAKQTSIFSMTHSAKVTLPALKRSGPRETSIQFRVALDRVKNLARAMGDTTLSNRDVGQKAFDYAYNDMVDEE
ncbi:ATP-binding protein [Novosphingobium sp. AP12]|uniref:ATP-binding protein n=1 Tax=Novosphingobium sp. AP12 TaxID=1144305 RepID=UPI000272107D|nr:ATP-binding protein [Novosphingobium sp. AP12]EJL22432.1 hypothetical protein PMI02_04664 [Novosphingobium sp. AP12]